MFGDADLPGDGGGGVFGDGDVFIGWRLPWDDAVAVRPDRAPAGVGRPYCPRPAPADAPG
ncbi:hypothetical protein GCM10010497_12830 [Streptomyces cinereoruber]|uniref:Uncharacterized protein n=1 Tax=Streptomyces cinereoruber TaxID=67260 RepID=A0AAV4KC65_9ACTN|nr:hypothetical protein GCM10010497_12830 [Streptomyces cinereoruber]